MKKEPNFEVVKVEELEGSINNKITLKSLVLPDLGEVVIIIPMIYVCVFHDEENPFTSKLSVGNKVSLPFG